MSDRVDLLRRAVQLSAISVLLSGLVGGTAVVIALGTGSLSLLGFGADAAIDSAASIALIWRFRVEAREPHRAERVERIAESVVGAALIALAVYLAFGAVRSLATGSHPEASTIAVFLLTFSVVVLPGLAIAKRRVAERLSSRALRGDSLLTAVAAVLAGVGLTSTVLATGFGVWWADAAGSLIIALVVVREGMLAVAASRSENAE